MANTFTQIHIHIVFAVKGRQSLINDAWKSDLYKYMTAIVQNNGHKVLQINGVSDHVHLLIGLRPSQALSDLVKLVKQDTSRWINQNLLTNHRFSWQAGYGAFSYSQDRLPYVIKYIQNQEVHHKKESFQDEFLSLLRENDMEYDPRFLFKPAED